MKQNEQEIQRFLQIREEIHEEIKKIEPGVALLQEVTQRFIAHFDVFQKLSQNAQEQVRTVIKGAAQEMAEEITEAVTTKIEGQIQNILKSLDQSVQKAKYSLESVSRKNKVKVVSIIILLILLGSMAGFGAGYFYNESRTYSLSKKLLETYQHEEKPQKTGTKMAPRNKPKN